MVSLMKSYFICSSAFQVFSAGYAALSFGQEKPELLIACEKRPNKITSSLLEISPWSAIHEIYYDVHTPSSFLLYNMHQFLNEIRNIVEPNSRVFIGSLNSLHVAIAVAFCASKELYLLDDGLETVMYFREGDYQENYVSRIKGFVKRKSFTLLGIPVATRAEIYRKIDGLVTWFHQSAPSNFTKEIKALSLSRQEDRPKKPLCLFLGQPFGTPAVRDYFSLDLSTYHQMLHSLAEYYQEKGYDFLYLLHPREEAEDSSFGFEVLRTEELSEIYLQNQSELPEYVASFFSTGLFTAKALFGDVINIDSWFLPEHFYLANPQRFLDAYQTLADFGVCSKSLSEHFPEFK